VSRTILVDADIFAYVASSATEGVFHFNGRDSEPAVDENLDKALEVAERDIEAVANKLKADKVIVCLTDDIDLTSGTVNNFRVDVYPQYKSNRLTTRKPSTLLRVKDFYSDRYECYQRPRLEADDCMGILSTHKTLVPGEKIIVSGDKDLQTIPGLLFNPKKDKKPRLISPLEADRFFMWQAIVGDTTDGYPGCRGVGPKSPFALAVLAAESLADMWQIAVDAYASKGFTPEDALAQARCARILRASDWDFQARKPRLWTPPMQSRTYD
jgi:5'-3' exonuclease